MLSRDRPLSIEPPVVRPTLFISDESSIGDQTADSQRPSDPLASIGPVKWFSSSSQCVEFNSPDAYCSESIVDNEEWQPSDVWRVTSRSAYSSRRASAAAATVDCELWSGRWSRDRYCPDPSSSSFGNSTADGELERMASVCGWNNPPRGFDGFAPSRDDLAARRQFRAVAAQPPLSPSAYTANRLSFADGFPTPTNGSPQQHRRSNSCRDRTAKTASLAIRRRDSHATAPAAAMTPDDDCRTTTTPSAADGQRTVLCAFIASTPSGDDVRLARQNGFKREDFALDKALNECNSIRADDTLVQGLLLRCMDNQPKYKFLHLAIYDAGFSAAPLSRSLSRRRASRASAIIGDLSADNEGAEIGVFAEVFTIQKPVVSAPLNEAALSVGRHAGYIVTSFKIYDEHYKQQSLEKNWLTWTGAREIYKYSPRTWNLRKISLHRHVDISGPIRTFAYVLICEFGNILHPSNTLQALDMCERLRVRNCGHIALYQVRYNYGPSLADDPPQRLGIQRNRSMSHGQNVVSSSPASPLRSSPSGSTGALPRKISASAHSSPSQSVGQSVGNYRGSVSPRGSTPVTISPSTAGTQYWDYAGSTSPWSSPTMARKNSAALSPRPPLNATASRRQMMQRGFSQDVDTSHETLRRRAALLRLRDASLGYDTTVALGAPAVLESASRGTSAGSMISAGYTMTGGGSGGGTPPRPVSPLAPSLGVPLAGHRYPQPQQPPRNSYIS